MLVPVAVLYLTSLLVGKFNGEAALANFIKFGYALIPLDLAGYLAHNLFHLLAEGKSVFYTAIAMLKPGYEGGSAALVSEGTIQIIQFVLIALGLLASLFTPYKISGFNFSGTRKILTTFLTYAMLLIILAIINIYLFTLPMSMRM